jgi:hypothetical protein
VDKQGNRKMQASNLIPIEVLDLMSKHSMYGHECRRVVKYTRKAMNGGCGSSFKVTSNGKMEDVGR